MSRLFIIAFLAFCGACNRWAGGGWPGHIWGGPSLLPGLVLGLGTATAFGWTIGAISGLGFIAYRAEGWGAYLPKEGIEGDMELSWIDHIIRPRWGWSMQANTIGWALRQIYVAPFVLALAFCANTALDLLILPVFVALVTAVYCGAFRFWFPSRLGISATTLAEVTTGLIWGGSILLGTSA